MTVGQVVEVCLLDDGGKPTGEWAPVTIKQIKRDHQTQSILSVRVSAGNGKNARHLWVQAEYLREPDIPSE